jgi:hypothetical protein
MPRLQRCKPFQFQQTPTKLCEKWTIMGTEQESYHASSPLIDRVVEYEWKSDRGHRDHKDANSEDEYQLYFSSEVVSLARMHALKHFRNFNYSLRCG